MPPRVTRSSARHNSSPTITPNLPSIAESSTSSSSSQSPRKRKAPASEPDDTQNHPIPLATPNRAVSKRSKLSSSAPMSESIENSASAQKRKQSRPKSAVIIQPSAAVPSSSNHRTTVAAGATSVVSPSLTQSRSSRGLKSANTPAAASTIATTSSSTTPATATTTTSSRRKKHHTTQSALLADDPVQSLHPHQAELHPGADQLATPSTSTAATVAAPATASNTNHLLQDSSLSSSQLLTSSLSRFLGFRTMQSEITRQMQGLRDLLTHIKQRDDPDLLQSALQELSEMLLMGNEDTLAGHFSPDAYIRQLIPLLQGQDPLVASPEIMLLACRCLSNMMEALPVTSATVVYHGAVPVLCSKLLSIEYIDVAEQALSTMEKISKEYPTVIVKAGGLEACLQFIDFFPLNTQRSAVTVAANCCRSLSKAHFSVVQRVIPILQQVLAHFDPLVAQQACLCVSRIAESFKSHNHKLESLITEDMLKALLALLNSTTIPTIPQKLRISLLRVLAFTARASHPRALSLLQLNVVDTLFYALCGVSAPPGPEHLAENLDRVAIMHSLIHRPREQVYEALNLVCDILPKPSLIGPNKGPNLGTITLHQPAIDTSYSSSSSSSSLASKSTSNQANQNPADSNPRVQMFAQCRAELRRFVVILFPTLTDAYASTVNLGVRQKVLAAHLEMLSSTDADILAEAVRPISYPSFLASIFSQNDHPSLIAYALQAAELLLQRFESVYRYQFFREGVFSAIGLLASRELQVSSPNTSSQADSDEDDQRSVVFISDDDSVDQHNTPVVRARPVFTEASSLQRAHNEDEDENADADDQETDGPLRAGTVDDDQDEENSEGDIEIDEGGGPEEDDNEDGERDGHVETDNDSDVDQEEGQHIEGDDEHNREDEEDEEDEEDGIMDDDDAFVEDYGDVSDDSGSDPDLSHSHQDDVALLISQDAITKRARLFIDRYDSDANNEVRHRASKNLKQLQDLSDEITTHVSCKRSLLVTPNNPFAKLASYFTQDELSSITSHELITSRVVDVLLDAFLDKNPSASYSRLAFLQSFMHQSSAYAPTLSHSKSPFSVLVYKLQDLLSRSEHFEVTTTQHAHDTGRTTPTNALGKTIRIRLLADGNDSSIPTHLRDMSIIIHALSTIRAVAEFLQSHFSTADATSRLSSSNPVFNSSLISALARGSSRTLGQTPFGASEAEGLMQDLARVLPGRGLDSANNRRHLLAALGSVTTPQNQNLAAHTEQPGANPSPAASPSLRRSRRQHHSRHQPFVQESVGSSSLLPASHMPTAGNDTPGQAPIECADETQINNVIELPGRDSTPQVATTQPENDVVTAAGGLSTVSIEVAPGGKAIARLEDGTRVATPSQAPSRPAPITRSASRYSAVSHAALGSSSAVVPQAGTENSNAPSEWHIAFFMDDQEIPLDSIIYRIVHLSTLSRENAASQSAFNQTHTIKYRKVPGPAPPPLTSHVDHQNNLGGFAVNIGALNSDGIPLSLENNLEAAKILQLLNILHSLKLNIDDVIADRKDEAQFAAEKLGQFVNAKFTAKLNRQLEEPLIVASGCLPSWSEDLPRHFPFLFPFETRYLFLQSTSFGFARSMSRWQSDMAGGQRGGRRALGRLQRQKVCIARSRILESTLKVMDLYGAAPPQLDVVFFDEAGTGLGPTLEFYSLASKEFGRKRLKLWRNGEADASSEYAFSPHGLFPAPMSESFAASDNGGKVLFLFLMLGKFVARSMIDSRAIDIAFNPVFFRIGARNSVSPSLGAMELIDAGLARVLRRLKKAVLTKQAIQEDQTLTKAQKEQRIDQIGISGVSIDNLALDFTLPGYPDIELIPNGAFVSVTINNLEEYIDKVLDFTLNRGVSKQLGAFRSGFSSVFPYAAIQAFTADELVMLFGRSNEDWSYETLVEAVKVDHGYTIESKPVQNLLKLMSELTEPERKDFLQFTTGSPKLPIGGFKALKPHFTVVCRLAENGLPAESSLPSVMTCTSYLKLPPYSSMEMLRDRMMLAIKEGQGAFHLS